MANNVKIVTLQGLQEFKTFIMNTVPTIECAEAADWDIFNAEITPNQPPSGGTENSGDNTEGGEGNGETPGGTNGESGSEGGDDTPQEPTEEENKDPLENEKVTIYDVTSSYGDLKTQFPDDYQNFTVDNFMIENLANSVSHSGNSGTWVDQINGGYSINASVSTAGSYSLSMSYNTTTGALSITNSVSASSKNSFVENPTSSKTNTALPTGMKVYLVY